MVKYHNLDPAVSDRKFSEILKWMWKHKKLPFLPRKTPFIHRDPNLSRPKKRLQPGNLEITFVNHATVLIQIGTINILTDPIWSDRCGPWGFIGPARISEPGIAFTDLPPIDIILLSHNHYDHCDLPTLRKLAKNKQTTIVVSEGNGVLMKKVGFKRIIELAWGQENEFANHLHIHSMPAQHFARRGLFDRNETHWCSFVIEAPEGRVFFAGDTGFGIHFEKIHEKFPDFDVALLPIAPYEPRWMMKAIHMSSEDAVKAHTLLQAKQSIAIHHGTFVLGAEDLNDAYTLLQNACQKAQIPLDRFQVLKNGEQFCLSSTN